MARPIVANHTWVSDDVIERALAFAARQIGVTGRTPVIVTRARYNLTGIAIAYPPERKQMYGSKCRAPDRLVHAVGGYIRIGLPYRLTSWFTLCPYESILGLARQFVELAMHEFAHVKQRQECLRKGVTLGSSYKEGRWNRMPWRQRPVEKDAEEKKDTALAKVAKTQQDEMDDVILDLAVELEKFVVFGWND